MSATYQKTSFSSTFCKFNRLSFAKPYADKNFYDRLFSGAKTPATVVRNINGNFYDEEYNALDEHKAVRMVLEALQETRVVVKPSIDMWVDAMYLC